MKLPPYFLMSEVVLELFSFTTPFNHFAAVTKVRLLSD